MEDFKKTYVDVNADHMKDGLCYPRMVRYTDGRIYRVDRLVSCSRLASGKGGGIGMRYTVRIGNITTFLFDEENGRWFVEGRV